METGPILSAHGGYRKLEAYKLAEIIQDATVVFCARLIDTRSRTTDQMIQAARSGKQNIAEGSMASGTSKKTELTLYSVARASLEELLIDYHDYIRQNAVSQWEKDNPKAVYIRKLAYKQDKTFEDYRQYLEAKTPETAANTVIVVIHQASFLLDRLKSKVERDFIASGGISEKMHAARIAARNRPG